MIQDHDPGDEHVDPIIVNVYTCSTLGGAALAMYFNNNYQQERPMLAVDFKIRLAGSDSDKT